MSEKKHVIGRSNDEHLGVLTTPAFDGVATADLHAIVRDALKANGLDPESVKSIPLVQPRTAPMFEPQPLRVSTKNALRPVGPQAAPAARDAAAAAPARRTRRSSAVLLTLIGLCALGSAAMAVHLARTKATFGVAFAAATAPR